MVPQRGESGSERNLRLVLGIDAIASVVGMAGAVAILPEAELSTTLWTGFLAANLVTWGGVVLFMVGKTLAQGLGLGQSKSESGDLAID